MAKLIIIRSNEYLNRLRAYRIYLNGIKLGNVGNGETKEFTVRPGKHQVCAKIDWCGSRTLSFEVAENETKTYEVGGFKHGNWLMPVSMTIVILHFILLFTIDFSYTFFLVLPAFLVFVYYTTIGKKDYLFIKEF